MRASCLCILLSIVMAGSTTGCHHTVQRPVIQEELAAGNDEVVLSATLRNGSTVDFNDRGASYYWMTVSEKQVLCVIGETREGERQVVQVSEIAEARVRSRKSDTAGTFMVVITVTAVAMTGLIFVLLSTLSWGGH